MLFLLALLLPAPLLARAGRWGEPVPGRVAARRISLAGFNLGIEAMQLAVIAGVLPTLLLLARTRARVPLRLGGTAFAAACAGGWLAERAFGLANPLQAVSDWLSPPPTWFALALGVAGAASAGALAWQARASAGRHGAAPAHAGAGAA